MSRFAVRLMRARCAGCDVIRVLIVASGVFVFLRLLLSAACEAWCVLHGLRVSKPIGRLRSGTPPSRMWKVADQLERREHADTPSFTLCNRFRKKGAPGGIPLLIGVTMLFVSAARRRPSLPVPSPSPGERSSRALFNTGDRGHGLWKWREVGGSAGRVCRICSPTCFPQSCLHALKLSCCFLKK